MTKIVMLTDELRASFRRSKCEHNNGVEVDLNTGDVFCRLCQLAVSPSHALIKLALDYTKMEERFAAIKREAEELATWTPRLRAVRRLHSIWAGRTMLPCCPHCGQGIKAETMLSSISAPTTADKPL